jgi:hypothetical protein
MVCRPGVFGSGESDGGGETEDSVGCGGELSGGELNGGVIDDGVADDGEARQWRGERGSSSISSGPRSSSASFCLFLSRLAGGGSATGSEGGGGVGVGGVGAAATGNDSCGRCRGSLAVVVAAARPRLARRRRLFSTVAADVAEADRTHMMVTVCFPAAW